MGRAKVCGFGTAFEARHWLSLDPCGCLGATLSWLVHLYALGAVFALLLGDSPAALLLFTFLYLPCALLAMASLFMASTTDPGAVPLGARPLTTLRPSGAAARGSGGNGNDTLSSATAAATSPRPLRRCHKCQDNFKPARAHHDSVTGRCIVKFDHYCPWVGNAVGARNHKFFCLFLLYTALCCLLSLLLLALRAARCGWPSSAAANGEEEAAAAADAMEPRLRRLAAAAATAAAAAPGAALDCAHFYDNRWLWLLAGASLLFLLFTTVMGCEQLEAIESGRGKIARMKMSVGQGGTEFRTVTEEFNEMFGGTSPRPAWHWFLPLPVNFPRGMEKVVLGYDWDATFDPEPYREAEAAAPGDDGAPEDEEAAGLQMTTAPVPGPGGHGMGARDVSSGSVSSDGLNRRRHESVERSGLEIV